MKVTRIIYKSHLLPPFVTPFATVRDFMQLMYPQEFADIANLRDTFVQLKYQEKEEQYLKVNNTIITQLYNFKEKYILPLKNCPFYYDDLHKQIQLMMENEKKTKLTYQQIQKNIPKGVVYRKFKNKYNKFRVEFSNHFFFKEVKYIPICVYTSLNQFLMEKHQNLGSVSQQEIVEIKGKYQEYLTKYNKKLINIASEANMTKDELLRLMKSQFNPFHTQILKQILLN